MSPDAFDFSSDVNEDDDGVADAHFQATRKHRISTANRGWQQAADLESGDSLLTDKVTKVTVLSVSVEDIVTDTYNLSVEGVHTFYVVDDSVAVLVHNTKPSVGGIYRGDDDYVGGTNDLVRREREWRRKGRRITPEHKIDDCETRRGTRVDRRK